MEYTRAFLTGSEIVLEHEGLFSNDPVDPGGATNWGISLRWLRSIGDWDGNGLPDGDIDGDGDVDVDDIRGMNRDTAVRLYFEHWWRPGRYGEIHRAELGWKVFDLSVNMGQPRGHRLFQVALQKMGTYRGKIDGAIGPKTLGAANGAVYWKVVEAFRAEAANFYLTLLDQKPAREMYRHGWLNRAYF